ncbi:MAG: DUF3536 domain-containing protein [Thermodesulfobacteriota bacterium]
MSKHLCIHGHFYQPPRVDPWLGEVLPEGSAAPALNWNQRITRESYAPLAFARRLDGSGRIVEVFNAYEWISFNYGPTLLSWMQAEEPAAYARVLEGDRRSAKRLGFGNAMAQVAHHQILPLASDLDKEIEVAWAVADFEARYGRAPEGMWLAEAAVDTSTLEVLAAQGLAYTVLAPRQAEAVRDLDNGDDGPWTPVDEGSLDVLEPYSVRLPSGRSIAVFFYHGPLSQAVAFERLLDDGENFWQRIRGAAKAGLLSLATDGETYGHHFTFGEMALAYMLTRARESGEVALTNYAAYLAANPPMREVRIRERSSWSCIHGVERWRADCGCVAGGHPGWSQKWRGPLRTALAGLKAGVDAHFLSRGKALFRDPRAALLDYGRVVAGSLERADFAARHFAARLPADEAGAAWMLLAMQRMGLRSLASCAWFFDDLDRIEPINALTYALRAMDLARETGGPDLGKDLLAALEPARANAAPRLNGRELFTTRVLPRRETPQSLIAQALLTHWGRSGELSGSIEVAWRRVSVRATLSSKARPYYAAGEAEITHFPEVVPHRYVWRWRAADTENPLDGTFAAAPADQAKDLDKAAWFSPAGLPWNKRQALSLAWVQGAEERAWRQQLQAARTGLELFQPLVESQTTQNLAWRWGRFWGALAWAYITTPDLPEDTQRALAAFLVSQAQNCPDQQAVSTRLTAEALAALDGEPPRLAQVLSLLSRAAAIKVAYDPWPIQNALWQLGPSRPEARPLATLLGFAV